MEPTKAMERLCGAETRSGGTCAKTAGWGTTHVGTARCRLHGGATPTHVRAAAAALARGFGGELDVEPVEALLWMVRAAAGEVAYATAMVEAIEPAGLVDGQQMNAWVVARRQAMDRLARFAAMTLGAGVAERQVRLAERYGGLIGQLLERVLAGLELTSAQRDAAPEIVRRELSVLEGGTP